MSEVIVLDTHIWIWLVNGSFDRFPTSWLSQLEQADRLGVSPLSCYEIAIAQKRGRLVLDCSTEEWLQEAFASGSFDLFPITPEITVRAANLSPIHQEIGFEAPSFQDGFVLECRWLKSPPYSAAIYTHQS